MQNINCQLFILPYAGGSGKSFEQLVSKLDPSISVTVIEYAGRGKRRKEPYAADFNALVNDVEKEIENNRIECESYALLGYSMGSIIAYEVLNKGGIKGTLKHVFVSAAVPPEERAKRLATIKGVTELDIIDYAKTLGGINDKILDDKRFCKVYLTPMIEDFRVYLGYKYNEMTRKIQTDATVFYSDQDTPLVSVDKWRSVFEGETIYYEFEGNHFFINQHYEEMAKIINNTLCL